MPAYKYTLKSGKTMWYANFYYTDWTGKKIQKLINNTNTFL